MSAMIAPFRRPPPPSPSPGVRLSVAVIPLPNFTLTTFSGLIDMLRLAADEGDRSRPKACSWTVMAPDMRAVRSSCGVDVLPWEVLGGAARFRYVVVVGGLLPMPRDKMLDERTLAFLRQAHAAGVELIGSCTGSLALVEAGLLRPGARCCVSWYHYADLIERFPDVTPVADRLWVREGGIATCAGGLAAVDLAAALIEQHLGGAAAQKSLHILLSDRARTAGAAQPQPPNMVPVGDSRVRRAMLLMEQNLSAPLCIEQIASTVAISKRQLERLFRQELGASLQTFGRDLRLSYAVWLMAHAPARISDIAAQCGFADAAHFSRVFRGAFGQSPVIARAAGVAALQAMLEAWWPYRPDTLPRSGRVSAMPGDRRPYL